MIIVWKKELAKKLKQKEKFIFDLKQIEEEYKSRKTSGKAVFQTEINIKKLKAKIQWSEKEIQDLLLKIKKPKISNKLEDFFEYHPKNDKVEDFTDWEKAIEIIIKRIKIKKINGILIGDKNKLLNPTDLKVLINNIIPNSKPELIERISKKINWVVEDKQIKPDEDFITFINGKYHIRSGEFFEQKNVDSINVIPHPYIKNSHSQLGEEILNRYIGKNIGFDKQIFEAVGLLMSQSKSFHFKCSIFANGDANFGKNFLFDEIIQPAVGWENLSNIDVSKLDEQRVASFINKTGVYDKDLSKETMSPYAIANFKKVSGGNKLQAKLLYRERLDFENYATVWINCNGLPIMPDRGSGGATFTRMQVIQFTVNVKEKYNDPNLYQKIKEKTKEISKWLIFNSAKCLTEALSRGTLTTTSSSLKAIKELKESDSVVIFLKNFFSAPENSSQTIRINHLYRAYDRTFLETEYNYGRNKVKKYSFIRTIKDNRKECDYRVFKSGGYLCIKKNNSVPLHDLDL